MDLPDAAAVRIDCAYPSEHVARLADTHAADAVRRERIAHFLASRLEILPVVRAAEERLEQQARRRFDQPLIQISNAGAAHLLRALEQSAVDRLADHVSLDR